MTMRSMPMLSVLIALTAGPARPQDPPTKNHPTDDSMSRPVGPPTRFIKASDLIGYDVRSTKEEGLGNVKDLLVDMSGQRIGFAVVSYGTFLGIGDKLYAVPWNAFKLDTHEKRATLNVDKEKLKKAPGFSKDVWPAGYDGNWAKELFTFYGTEPSWMPCEARTDLGTPTADDHVAPAKERGSKAGDSTSQQLLRLYRASKLIGLKVESPSEENLGKVEDLAVEADQGHVLYGVLSFGGFLGMGDKYFAIPLDLFQIKVGGEALILSVDKDTLKSAPGFDKSAWPDMANPRTTTEIHAYYGRRPYWERHEDSKN